MTGTETEMRIIEAAVSCIEKYGFEQVTVRRIAQEAKVNVAAINYHFGSKEQLMDKVMDITLVNAFDWSHFSPTEDSPPKERLAFILGHLVEGAQRFPEITRAHFVSPLIERRKDTATFVRFEEFLEKLYEDLKSRGACADPHELRLSVLQAVTATIIGIGIFGELLEGFAGFSLSSAEARKEYIERIVSRIL